MKKVLIIVDIQNDFCKGGSLEVPNANEIIPIVNDLSKKDYFDMVIYTKDWHPSNHKSFASNNPGKKLFEMTKLNGINQVMWPNHCVQDTFGSKIHEDLNLNLENMYIFKKGMNPEVDSYSAFYDNDGKTSTGLTKFLKENKITDTYITGLTTDYCAKFTALDSKKDGFNTHFIWDATRGISEDLTSVMQELIDNKIIISSLKDFS